MKNKIRMRMRFYGRVQGVGFRYKATVLAQYLDLTGFVENEDEGSVLMEVQGEEPQMDKLLQRLDEDRYIRIEAIDKKVIPVCEEEYGFNTRGW